MTNSTPTITAVAAFVAARRRDPDWQADGRLEVLAAQAAALAAAIDGSDNVRSTAEASRELRQVLAELRPDPAAAADASFAALVAELRAAEE